MPLATIGGRGLFTKEIENHLIEGDIDLAVHSLKDLPVDLPEELALQAVLPRGDVRDALISRTGRTLQEISPGETIATSSVRRKAQLLAYNGALEITDIRGNIDTRLRKLEAGNSDALIVAACGVIRAGYSEKITEFLPIEIMLPAAGQGIIGIEVRKDDEALERLLQPINDTDTFVMATAERAFLAALGGGCQVPIGCYSKIAHNVLHMRGFLSNAQGRAIIRKESSGPSSEAVAVARGLALQMIDEGGEAILRAFR